MANYTNVSFAGSSLQTANIMVNNIQHFAIPAKGMSLMALDHNNKSVIPFTSYNTRVVLIEGTIQGSSIADLDARLDAFKLLFNNQDQNLDIDYNGTTRRYIATLDSANSNIDRPGGLLYASFSLQFVCTTPFGMDTGTSSLLSATARTNSSYTDAITVLGTAPQQLPIFTYTFTNPVTGATNFVTNGTFETDLSGWSSGGVGTATRVTTQFHSGVASMQIVNAGAAVSGNFAWELNFVAGLTIGGSYTVSLWLKGNAGGESVTIGIGGASKTVALTTSWQQFFLSFTATGTTQELDLTSTSPASATWFVDDVTVVANAAALVFIGNNANGQGITLQRTFAAGDVLVIDCTQRLVTLNGNTINFSGAFPELSPGAQSLSYVDGFISRTFNVSVVQTPLYL